MSGGLAGPALVICPECGEEIGREFLFVGKPGQKHTCFVLPLPKTCPFCDASLGLPNHPKVAPKGQATLAGVA